MKKYLLIIAMVFSSTLLITSCNSNKKELVEKEIPSGDQGRRLYFDLMCKKGHFGDCAQLAKMYGNGWGGKKDKKTSLKYHAMACEHGVEQSCVDVNKSLTFKEELKIYEQDCAANNAYACNNMGHLMWLGKHTVRNIKAARAPLDKACQLKISSSCASVAKMWDMGIGGQKDAEKAKQFKKKAEQFKKEEDAIKLKYHLMIPKEDLPVAIPTKGLLKIETITDGGFSKIKNAREGKSSGHEGHNHEGHNHKGHNHEGHNH